MSYCQITENFKGGKIKKKDKKNDIISLIIGIIIIILFVLVFSYFSLIKK